MRQFVFAFLCTALAGCSGSISAVIEENAPPLTIYSFAPAFETARAMMPTTDMPTSGTAHYDGAVRLDVVDASAVPLGAVSGQLSFDVAFDQATGAGGGSVVHAPVTGTLDGFGGQATSGDPLDWSGSLSTANAAEPSFAVIDTSTYPDPEGGEITLSTAALSAQFAGPVTVSDGAATISGTAEVSLGGTFVGDAGSEVWGSATAVVLPQGQGAGPDQGTAPLLTGTGEFVAGR